MPKPWANRKQMFCNDNCRSGYFADIRYGLAAGFDKYTDKMAEQRICLYCGHVVPTNEQKRWSQERNTERVFVLEDHICDDCHRNVIANGHNWAIEH